MQTHKKLKARILSLVLSAAMVTTMMPMNAFAAESGTAPGTSSVGTIQSFDKLDSRFDPSTGKDAPSHVYGLAVELDTPEEDLNLPDELTAMVARTTTVSAPAEDEPVVDSGKEDEPAKEETIPNEDEVVEDTDADETVSDNQPATPSDAQDEVKEEIKDEEIPLAPEPEQDEETTVTNVEQETIPVTWNSDKEYVSDENGQFIYTAEISEDYTLADGVKLPQIYVMVGRQARMANTTKIIVGGDNASNSAGLNGPYPATMEGLSYAFFEAVDGATIQLGADISDDTGSPALFNPSTLSTLTFDLNGKTISSTGSISGGLGIIGVFANGANATLNITDSIGGGKLIVDDSAAISAAGSADYTGTKYTATLNISGGIITSTNGIAICNDASGGGTANVNISGGTISAPTAYLKYDASGTYTTSLKITGGSIKGDLADSDSGALPIPKNGSNANVYLTTITLSGLTEGTEVTAITGAGGYSVDGLSTDSSGKVYFWLPENTVITAVTAGGTVYSGSVTTASDNTAAATFTSGPSITVGTQPTSPAAMTYGTITGSLTVAGTASNSNTVSYQWYQNTTNSATGGSAVTGATSANFTIPTTLGAGTHYYYCVLKATDCADKASNVATVTVNKAGYSGSTTASVSVKSDTANSAATTTLPTPTTGATYGTVTVTTSNGLISGTPTVSGTTLTMNVASKSANTTETLTVAINGGTNYNDATMTVTVTAVDKTPVTVTGLTAATGLTYSGSAQNGYTGTLSVEGNKVPVSELVYSYTSTDSGTYNSSIAPTNAGAYKLTIKIADSNASYTGAHADITFTIGKKAATVTADNKSIVIGAAKPTYTATTDGLVSGQSISGVAFTDTATDTNTKGTFDITPSGGTITGGNGNYSITYTKGILTITVATQVIDTAIANANAAKNGIAINEGAPSSVANGTKYVTAAEMKALTDAIAAAEAAKSTAGTAAEAQAAATALDNAVAAFKAAIKTGTYTSSSGGGGGGSSSSSQTILTSVPPAYTGGTKIIGNVRVPDYTVEGNWIKNENGTWTFAGDGGQTYVNTWAPVFNPYASVANGQSAFDWFMFDANGSMMTGWYTDADGNTYYLNPNSDNTLGAMQTGWVLIDGKNYYFNEMPDGTRGKLFRNTRTPDGYLVYENGMWDGKDKQ